MCTVYGTLYNVYIVDNVYSVLYTVQCVHCRQCVQCSVLCVSWPDGLVCDCILHVSSWGPASRHRAVVGWGPGGTAPEYREHSFSNTWQHPSYSSSSSSSSWVGNNHFPCRVHNFQLSFYTHTHTRGKKTNITSSENVVLFLKNLHIQLVYEP